MSIWTRLNVAPPKAINLELQIVLKQTQLIIRNNMWNITCHMKDGFEPQSKPSNFETIFFFDAAVDALYAFPVLFCEDLIIVYKQSWGL